MQNHPKKLEDGSDDKTVNMKDLTVTITNDKAFPCKDKVKQEKNLSGEYVPRKYFNQYKSKSTCWKYCICCCIIAMKADLTPTLLRSTMKYYLKHCK